MVSKTLFGNKTPDVNVSLKEGIVIMLSFQTQSHSRRAVVLSRILISVSVATDIFSSGVP